MDYRCGAAPKPFLENFKIGSKTDKEVKYSQNGLLLYIILFDSYIRTWNQKTMQVVVSDLALMINTDVLHT